MEAELKKRALGNQRSESKDSKPPEATAKGKAKAKADLPYPSEGVGSFARSAMNQATNNYGNQKWDAKMARQKKAEGN
jgi:hypothetical protein